MKNTPATVVVVDDDQDTVKFFSDFFTMFDMRVESCPVNIHVLACIVEQHPSVVILDLRLDHLTGVDILHQMRAHPSLHIVPVVFFTGSDDYLRQLLPDYAAHNAYVVRKPDVEKLSILVQELVG
jgi:DNA-binding response OmpR family regulator